MSRSSRGSGFQQLVGDVGQRTDHDHRLRANPAPHDADQPPNGGPIFDRRASKLHHHHVVASVESALSLEFLYRFGDISAHSRLRFYSLLRILGAKKNPPPDRFWRWVRVILLRVLTSSDSVLQK